MKMKLTGLKVNGDYREFKIRYEREFADSGSGKLEVFCFSLIKLCKILI